MDSQKNAKLAHQVAKVKQRKSSRLVNCSTAATIALVICFSPLTTDKLEGVVLLLKNVCLIAVLPDLSITNIPDS